MFRFSTLCSAQCGINSHTYLGRVKLISYLTEQSETWWTEGSLKEEDNGANEIFLGVTPNLR